MSPDADVFLGRLLAATNDHDLDALVGCFSPGYRNETPAHPSRSFAGDEQVRDNWRQIFAFVPDVQARVLQSVATDSEVWSEWEMSGTRLDGTRHLMRGVIIFGVLGGRAATGRFFLEPVDEGALTAGQAVRSQTHSSDGST